MSRTRGPFSRFDGDQLDSAADIGHSAFVEVGRIAERSVRPVRTE